MSENTEGTRMVCNYISDATILGTCLCCGRKFGYRTAMINNITVVNVACYDDPIQSKCDLENIVCRTSQCPINTDQQMVLNTQFENVFLDLLHKHHAAGIIVNHNNPLIEIVVLNDAFLKIYKKDTFNLINRIDPDANEKIVIFYEDGYVLYFDDECGFFIEPN